MAINLLCILANSQKIIGHLQKCTKPSGLQVNSSPHPPPPSRLQDYHLRRSPRTRIPEDRLGRIQPAEQESHSNKLD